MKLTFRCLVDINDKRIPLEELTEEQRKHFVEAGTEKAIYSLRSKNTRVTRIK